MANRVPVSHVTSDALLGGVIQRPRETVNNEGTKVPAHGNYFKSKGESQERAIKRITNAE